MLTGQKEQQPRWKRCLQATDFALGEALGQAYVHETFSPAASARALAMVDNLIAALDERLHTLEWMSDSTRAQALAKLRAVPQEDRLPRQVARLLGAHGRRADPYYAATRCAPRRSSSARNTGQHRQAGGPRRSGA